MKTLFTAFLVIVTALWSFDAFCQTSRTSSASATSVSSSSSRPGSIAIKRNILQMQQRQILSEISVAQLCIKNAAQPTTLRDPQGNFNIVPQTDLVNCQRILRGLTRRLDSLVRQTRSLGQDATAQALYLERRARQAEFLRRSAMGGGSR